MTLPIMIRDVREADIPRARGTFSEGHKNAPANKSMPWRHYKRFVVPELDRVLRDPSTDLVGAYLNLELVGWIAFSRGERVDTIHWVSTSYWVPVLSSACTGCADAHRHTGACPLARANRTELRHRGVMTALLDAVEPKERLVYTHKGALHEYRSDGKTMDERLLPWLAARGHKIAYVPWEEWISQ
jgi:hypothetical protein